MVDGLWLCEGSVRDAGTATHDEKRVVSEHVICQSVRDLAELVLLHPISASTIRVCVSRYHIHAMDVKPKDPRV